jgi:hypothetical protein
MCLHRCCGMITCARLVVDHTPGRIETVHHNISIGLNNSQGTINLQRIKNTGTESCRGGNWSIQSGLFPFRPFPVRPLPFRPGYEHVFVVSAISTKSCPNMKYTGWPQYANSVTETFKTFTICFLLAGDIACALHVTSATFPLVVHL